MIPDLVPTENLWGCFEEIAKANFTELHYRASSHSVRGVAETSSRRVQQASRWLQCFGLLSVCAQLTTEWSQ